MNAEGSAMKEQAKWMQGLEAKTNQFKAALEELSITAASSDFLGGAIDAGTQFIELLTAIIDQLGIIPTLIGGAGIGHGIFSSIKGNGRLKMSSLIFMY